VVLLTVGSGRERSNKMVMGVLELVVKLLVLIEHHIYCLMDRSRTALLVCLCVTDVTTDDA
jgi:hypothetical protein